MTFNSVNKAGVARISANGTLDTAFAAGGLRFRENVVVLQDDSVIVTSDNLMMFTYENACLANIFTWYTPAGTAKPMPSVDPNSLYSISSLLALPDGGFVLGGDYSAVCINGTPTGNEGQAWRYAGDGTYDTLASFGDRTYINTLARRSDGKMVVGGLGETSKSGQINLFSGMALVDLSNNSLEKVATFHPLVGDETYVGSISQYADGKVLVGGTFTHANGQLHYGLARLLANGALDASFHPFADRPLDVPTNAVLALPDGRSVVSAGNNKLYLVSAVGALTDISSFNGYDNASTLLRQADGKVLVGTGFGLGLRRIKADFTAADPAFHNGSISGGILALAQQADGKILAAGSFNKYNNANVPGIVRLLNDGVNDGVLDTSFSPPSFLNEHADDGVILALLPLPGEKILIGGDFARVGGVDRESIVRLNANGTVDTTFTSPTGVGTIFSMCRLADGSLWASANADAQAGLGALQHFGPDGALIETPSISFLAAHRSAAVFNILCGPSGIDWANGAFSSIDGQPFYSLAQVFSGRIFLPLVRR